MSKILTLIAFLLFSLVAFGQRDTVIASITYQLYPDGTAAVRSTPRPFFRDGNMVSAINGHVDIPAVITRNGVDYRVTTLESKCFEQCFGITSVSLPEALEELQSGCFYGCHALRKVHIPKNVKFISGDFAAHCWNLDSLSVDPANAMYDSRGNCNAIIDTKKNLLVAACNNTVIPNDVKALGHKSFEIRNFQHITIPNGTEALGHACFALNHRLRSVNIPESVTFLGMECFVYCDSLTSITLPNNIPFLYSGTFRGCKSLKKVVVPDSVKEIGDACFAECSSLDTVVLPANLKEIYFDCFRGCDNLKTIVCKSLIPPSTISPVFPGADVKNIRLYVPRRAVKTYKQTAVWKDFDVRKINELKKKIK